VSCWQQWWFGFLTLFKKLKHVLIVTGYTTCISNIMTCVWMSVQHMVSFSHFVVFITKHE
jgi:hypothetical protein